MLWKLTAVAFAATLVACGSGSDVVEADTTTIEGAIVKGPVHKAKVAAYKVNADGSRGDKLGDEVRSEADGSYKLSFSGYSGVVVIEAAADGETAIKDEATGTDVKPGSSFKLRSAVSLPPTGRTFKVQVNPLTDVAVAAAQRKTGEFSAANVEQANAELRSSVTGFDPLEDKPTFDANGIATNKAGVMMAAVSQMAKQGDLGCTTGDAAVKINCVVGELSKRTNGLTDSMITLNTRLEEVKVATGVTAPKVKTPDLTAVTPAKAVDQAKAMIGGLRSNAKALDATDLSLTTELQAVADDMQKWVIPFSGSAVELNANIFSAAQYWQELKAKPEAALTFPIRPMFGRTNYSGKSDYLSCAFYSDSSYEPQFEATNKSQAKYMACGSQWAIGSDSVLGKVAWSLRVRLHEGATADQYTVHTQTRKAKVIWDQANFKYDEPASKVRTHFPTSFPGNTMQLAVTRNAAGEVVGASLKGEMAPDYEKNNIGGYTVVAAKRTVDFNAGYTKVNGIETVTLEGNGAAINADGSVHSSIALGKGTLLQGAGFEQGGRGYKEDGSHKAVMVIKAATAKSAVEGQIEVTDAKLDASKTVYLPTNAFFAGRVAKVANGVETNFLKGSVRVQLVDFANYNDRLPLSKTNVQIIKSTIMADVNIPTRSVLGVDLTLLGSNRGAGNGSTVSLSGQYRQSPLVVNLDASATDGVPAKVTLTSADGIRIELDGTKKQHPITRMGASVGTYDEVSKKVTYSDGTFEQF